MKTYSTVEEHLSLFLVVFADCHMFWH